MLLSLAERRGAEELARGVRFDPIADHLEFQERFLSNLTFPPPPLPSARG
jgi:hypothetical protein